ncbi:MAG: hypothetical protein AAGB11_14900 [Pseudomonadota bacterium]
MTVLQLPLSLTLQGLLGGEAPEPGSIEAAFAGLSVLAVAAQGAVSGDGADPLRNDAEDEIEGTVLEDVPAEAGVP